MFASNFKARIIRLLLFVTAVVTITSCSKKKLVKIDPEFSKYIEAYTSGVISRKNTVRIVLAGDANVTHSINESVKESLFEFSPAVKGSAVWIDARTIEFRPEKEMKADQLYEVEFALSKVMKVPSKYGNFVFNVQTIKPAFMVQEEGLRATSKTQMNYSGILYTADVEDGTNVEKILSAKLDGSAIKVAWQHNDAAKEHKFTLSNITRTANAGKLILQSNGGAIGIDSKDDKEVDVPAEGDFKVLAVRAIQDAEQYVLVQFSDMILTGQMLDGLIAVSNQENISYTIVGSEVKVYCGSKLDGNYTVTVNEGIQNQWGQKLDKAFTSNLSFDNKMPSVKIHGKGNILPNSTGRLLLPFEAVNLKSVDVSIIKIYENNIPQFLQYNNLDGESELRRVAKPVVQATLKLDEDKSVNLHKKNRFLLDIDKYIKTEPGAIYRVNIAFRPEYSVYACAVVEKDKDDDYYDYYDDEQTGNVDDDDEFWRRYNDYNPYGYNWEQRDNPCHASYYNRERFASRNIIASNLGLTVKKGNNNNILVAVSNIITTDAMNGVELKVLDYQNQIIATSKSNADGIAMIDIKRKPYLLIASNGNEKGYLKLDDGSALALSRFDVSGAEIKNGIKGFIFGERGVWRPGDSLFLSCIIEDKAKKLPADHPIEMELISPRGQLYKRIVTTNAADGFNVFRTATDAAAPTGNWLCKVKVGGAVFEKKLKIETVMPNRLKINLDFGNEKALGKNATTNGVLSAKWLFGATAQSLKARIDAQLYKKQTIFANYKNYVFDDPTASFASQSKTIFDGSLSAEGTANVSPNFEAGEHPPGMLLANLMVKVFEPGGNFSVDNISMPYHPYNAYIGVKAPEGDKTWGWLQSGKSHTFEIAEVNTNGVATQGSTNVTAELYKIQWRWWWDNSGDDLSNFTQDSYNKLISTHQTIISNGKGAYDVKLNASEYGRYLLLLKDNNSGHTTGTTFYVDDYNWQNHADNNDASAASMLSFTSDKQTYNVGDEVKLTIPSSKGGKALISIENGSKVLETKWVKTEQGQTKYSFKVDKGMAPNVYVNVSLIQPHAQTINDLPIRMYGVIPILIDDKNTILKPVIKMADVIKPEVQKSITVSEANGKDMSYVIAIVDEGLLDLTRFKTPDPHETFYEREALGVKSWDVYDFVIGAWSGQLDKILTIGGDAEADLAAKTRRANRFQPVVKYMGPFKTNGGSKTHNFTLPQYMGSVRAMVIAANQDGAYGAAEKSVQVKKPLMMLATLPRVLGPGEELKIPVTVFATENNIKSVTLNLGTNNLIQPVSGSNTASAVFAKPGEQTVYLNARVGNNTGIGKLKITANGGKETAVYEVEIEVRNPNPAITQITEATLQPGQSWNNVTTMIGDAANSKAVVEVSSLPAMNLEKRLNYLIKYPHGCIEQTTSAAFPQLVLNQLLDLDDARKAQVTNNVNMAIQKLQNFQQSDGGFSYWPGNDGSDDWGSSYAGHFLLEAAANGYSVPAGMLNSWKNYVRNKAQAWNITSAPWYGSDLTQAYTLYLLALSKSPDMGAMNRLKEFKFLTPEAKWRLAGAYHLAGQSSVALQLISGLPTTFPVRPNPGYTFGSDLRDQAMVLEVLTIMERKSEATALVRSIAAKLAHEQWYSTQTTAYSLIAIAKFSGSNKDGKKISIAGKAGGANISANTAASVVQTKIAWQSGKANINIKNNANNVLYVRVINEGKPASGTAIPVNNNPAILNVTATYITTNGQPIDVANIKQGTDFVARVTVRNPGQRGVYDNMALSQIFPSGWEILNTRLYNSEGAFTSSPAEYMDIRDDRVYHYFDIKQGETLTYYVQLNAAYPGKYYWPGVYAEAMYDNTINGGVAGKWIQVSE